MKQLVYLIIIVICLGSVPAFACTGITASSGQQVLVGSNEDYSTTYKDTVARIRPPTEGKYGCLLLGFQRQSFSMLGINEKGLFFDMFSIPEVQWTASPDKQNFNGFFEGKMMEECANVEEAIHFLQEYNNPGLGNHQIFVVDKTGMSAVINWWDGEIEVIRKEDNYQVVTNFFLLHPEYGWYPCWRYTTADEMIKNAGEFSVDSFRSILDAVHGDATNFSDICELPNGDMYIYNNHNFHEFIKLNIHEELQKGWNDYYLPYYFSEITLLSPGEDDLIRQSQVTFEWDGKPDSDYQFYYSPNPDFTNSQPLEPAAAISRSNLAFYGTSIGFLFMGILSFTVTSRDKKKPLLIWMVPLVLIVVLVTCHTVERSDNDETGPPFSITVEDLQPNTTYYWKVTANSTGNIISESIVRRFTTGE